MRTQQIKVKDGFKLGVRVFESTGPATGSVVIAAAMGVRQDFYTPFAQWLAGQGWRVLSFSYRGTGDSLPAGVRLRGFQADLHDWVRDFEAVIDFAHTDRPKLPLLLLGHSLGAQLAGLLANADKVSGLLSVAAGSGYWRENTPRLRFVVPYFWFFVVPLATRLCGYFPGRSLRMVGDIPAGAMLQWRRWCLHPRYSVGVEGEAARARYAGVRYPLLALSISDDELMTLQGTRSLVRLYANAPSEVRRIVPADLGLRRIGHFGPFKAEHEPGLWPLMQQALHELLQRPVRLGQD
ncbi:MAG: alpha/beta fold hydrolase [Pseudomonadota bacterium]